MTDQQQDARLTAIAIVRAILNDDELAYTTLLDTTDNHRDLAAASAGLAATLMATLPDDFTARALDAFVLSGLTDSGDAASS